jgi:hypothetical protein
VRILNYMSISWSRHIARGSTLQNKNEIENHMSLMHDFRWRILFWSKTWSLEKGFKKFDQVMVKIRRSTIVIWWGAGGSHECRGPRWFDWEAPWKTIARMLRTHCHRIGREASWGNDHWEVVIYTKQTSNRESQKKGHQAFWWWGCHSKLLHDRSVDIDVREIPCIDQCNRVTANRRQQSAGLSAQPASLSRIMHQSDNRHR